MKYIINKLNPIALMFFFVLGISITGCKKESSAPPIIDRVRLTDAALADSSLDKAVPGTYLVIEGKNLGGANKVLFNGYEAFFNVAFNTDSHLFVQIPLRTPTPDRDPSVANTIEVFTPAGRAEYSFAINPPPPIIASIENLNTKPGMVMTIKGDFLLGVEEVEFPGGLKGTNLVKNEEGSELKVTVPAALSETGVITLKSPYGSTKSRFLVNNTAGPGVFANFDNPNAPQFGWEWWGAQRSNNATEFPNNYDHYIKSSFGGIGPDDFGWWTNNRVITVGNFTSIFPEAELSTPPDNYYLAFEINTKVPIRKGTIFLIEFFVDTNKQKSLRMLPYIYGENQVLDTKGAWKTILVPLKEFNVSTMGDLLENWGAIGRFHIGIISDLDNGIENFNAAFDNLRIEKVQQ